MMLLVCLMISSAATITAAEVKEEPLSQMEFAAILNVESLLSHVDEVDELGFLEKSTEKILMSQDEFNCGSSEPESSSLAETRQSNLRLHQRLLEAYHNAILSECEQLEKLTQSIGSQVFEVSRDSETYLVQINKYLAALINRCQNKLNDGRQQEPPPANREERQEPTAWYEDVLNALRSLF